MPIGNGMREKTTQRAMQEVLDTFARYCKILGSDGMMCDPRLWNHIAFCTRTRVRQAMPCLNSLVCGA